MICPKCEYENGWNWEEQKLLEGLEGDFFTHPVKAERPNPYDPPLSKTVYGCPACGIMFIEVD